MKHFKINTAVLAILVGVGVVAAQASFTAPVKNTKKPLYFDYKYNGTDLAHDKYADFYTKVTHHGDDPVCDNGLNLPCELSVNGDLQTWLNAHTNLSVVSDVQCIATKD